MGIVRTFADSCGCNSVALTVKSKCTRCLRQKLFVRDTATVNQSAPSQLLSRRRLIQLGVPGMLVPSVGLSSFPTELFARSKSEPNKPIESCILVMYYGGPSHIDTWDMKPDAPAEIRGEFKPISTNTPGRFVCEHLPLTARIVDRLSVIRSMHHPMTNHNSAMYESLIGRLPVGGDVDVLGANRITDFPNHGAVLSYLATQGEIVRKRGNPLINVALPHVMHNVVDLAGQNAGFLGAKYDPFQVLRDPNSPDFRIEALSENRNVPPSRQRARRELLASLDQHSTNGLTTPDLDANRARAYELIGQANVREAFEIKREPSKVRERYGRTKLGQSMLLARRLVEAGVRFINVNDKVYNGQLANWDCHADNFRRHRELLPPADQAFSALITDLEERGRLESTLVIAMGEFGRTPKVNLNAGRDHWPQVGGGLIAGGGVVGGATFGASDKIGAYPTADGVTPGDLAATIFWRFGLDPHQEIHDALGRPFPLAAGKPIRGLF